MVSSILHLNMIIIRWKFFLRIFPPYSKHYHPLPSVLQVKLIKAEARSRSRSSVLCKSRAHRSWGDLTFYEIKTKRTKKNSFLEEMRATRAQLRACPLISVDLLLQALLVGPDKVSHRQTHMPMNTHTHAPNSGLTLSDQDAWRECENISASLGSLLGNKANIVPKCWAIALVGTVTF